jgi:ACS family hexuronate transporter-like MFS transporter
MSDIDYATIVQAFLLAYTVTFIFAGRFTDWLGTRLSLAAFIAWWSVANMLTALSRSSFSLGAFRFLLGVGEPGNYTAAPKAVSEWFPPKERGLAVGIYRAGATVGATIAPPVIALFATSYGWRATFVFTGLLGPPPCAVGLVRGSMTLSCSMMEPGQPCEMSTGKALSCFERT